MPLNAGTASEPMICGRDEEMDAVDEVLGEEGGVEAGAGFGEEGEDAFGAEMVEDGGEAERGP